jgi:hypothetical protein
MNIIAPMTEAIHTYETSEHFYVTTRRYMPENSKFHILRRENLKYNLHVTYK